MHFSIGFIVMSWRLMLAWTFCTSLCPSACRQTSTVCRCSFQQTISDVHVFVRQCLQKACTLLHRRWWTHTADLSSLTVWSVVLLTGSMNRPEVSWYLDCCLCLLAALLLRDFTQLFHCFCFRVAVLVPTEQTSSLVSGFYFQPLFVTLSQPVVFLLCSCSQRPDTPQPHS